MKPIVLIMLTLSSIFGCKPNKDSIVQKLDVANFKKGIEAKNVQLVDVRTKNEFSKGHIKNAVLIDYFSRDFKEQLSTLDKDAPVYLYCRSGNRSGKAAKVFERLGFKEVYDLKGGYLSWKKNNP